MANVVPRTARAIAAAVGEGVRDSFERDDEQWCVVHYKKHGKVAIRDRHTDDSDEIEILSIECTTIADGIALARERLGRSVIVAGFAIEGYDEREAALRTMARGGLSPTNPNLEDWYQCVFPASGGQ